MTLPNEDGDSDDDWQRARIITRSARWAKFKAKNQNPDDPHEKVKSEPNTLVGGLMTWHIYRYEKPLFLSTQRSVTNKTSLPAMY